MNELYLGLKVVHLLSATVLFGTGLGTAFHMWLAHRSGDVATIAHVARNVVVADFLFTTPAVIVQPLSGAALMGIAGYDAGASWLVVAYGLYLLAGACWLPVVWLQIRVSRIARQALKAGHALPPPYYRAMRLWFALGWPAFASVIAIIWLMVAKPPLW